MKRYADGGRYVPRKCVFEVTLACNLRCGHCGSGAGKPRTDELSTGEIARIMSELAALGCRKVTISGGEALLRSDWSEIVSAASGAGMKTGLVTNGVLFDREAARTAVSVGLDAIGFSLDGIGEMHDRARRCPGLFPRVLRGFEAAAGAGLRFCAITQISTRNLGALRGIRDLLVERGAFAWQVQPAIPMGELCHDVELSLRPEDVVRASAEVAALIAEDVIRIDVGDSLGYFGPDETTLRRSLGGGYFGGCQAGKRMVGIESDGSVKGCLSIQPGNNPGRDRFVEGNLRERSLAEIWNRPGAFAYSREWSLDDLSGFCRRCLFAERCRGGCRSTQVAFGGGDGNPLCVYRALAERRAKSGTANAGTAAAVLAAFLAFGVQGCVGCTQTVGYYDAPCTGNECDIDADTDSDTDSDTDTDTDTDSDTDTDTDPNPDGGVDGGADAGQ